jgi:hypothetical protein
MLGAAHLIEGVNQGVLALGFECDIEVHCGSGRRETQALPILWDGVPCVLDAYIVPRRREGRRKAEKRNSQ